MYKRDSGRFEGREQFRASKLEKARQMAGPGCKFKSRTVGGGEARTRNRFAKKIMTFQKWDDNVPANLSSTEFNRINCK